jgi:hypothetical protein
MDSLTSPAPSVIYRTKYTTHGTKGANKISQVMNVSNDEFMAIRSGSGNNKGRIPLFIDLPLEVNTIKTIVSANKKRIRMKLLCESMAMELKCPKSDKRSYRIFSPASFQERDWDCTI